MTQRSREASTAASQTRGLRVYPRRAGSLGRRLYSRRAGTPGRHQVARIAEALVLLALLSGCATLAQAPEATLEREVLLTVAEREPSALALTGPPDSRYVRRRGYAAASPEVDRVLNQLAKDHGLERKEGWPIRSLSVYCEVFVVPSGRDVEKAVERLSADPRVDLAQPMHLFETLGDYDDPLADLQAATIDLGIAAAHRLATGKGVEVAVIDSAVDAAHPELAGRVSMSRDVVEPRSHRPRAELHGTAVAGIIAAAANNREGIVGIAPDVRIVSLRACWPHPAADGRARCSSLTLARAMEAALGTRARVINLSLSGPRDPLLERLLDEAAARGVVVVAAEPPPNGQDHSFPSGHSGVLVARSSTGYGSGLPAPAEEILTTTPGAGYAFLSGTSLAAAHVSGVAALLLERDPGLDAARLAAMLKRTVVQQELGATVNACHALQELMDVRVCDEVRTAAR